MTDADAPVATITAQTETVSTDPNNRGGMGYRIEFKTTKGAQGSVWLPKTAYNAESAKAAVRAHALELDAVQGATV